MARKYSIEIEKKHEEISNAIFFTYRCSAGISHLCVSRAVWNLKWRNSGIRKL